MPDHPPPPPPPPHGHAPRPPGGLPDGNYDIFIIPPHSAGSGFLYLPSLQPHRNSFIAGIAVALASVGIYAVVMPVIKAWLATVVAGNAWGVLVLVVIVGVGAWAYGKTSGEQTQSGSNGTGGADGGPGSSQQQQHGSWGAPPNANQGANQGAYTAPPPPNSPQPEQSKPKPSSAQTGWEKAREETRKREEARKRTEEAERRRAEAAKVREEAERAAKAKAEKEKWEQARAREKEQREREAREKKATSTPDKEIRDKAIRERLDRLRKEREERQKASSSPSATGRTSPKKEYVRPTARSAVGPEEEEYSFRPYDTPPPPKHKTAPYKHSSASSISGLSESSYAASQTTARTTPPPPPNMRGPYSTSDPDKILIRAVYLFNDSFPTKPVSQLVVGQGSVTDGLVLNIRTEGLFIDDDVRKVPQREWDVKAWTLKLVEDGSLKASVVGGRGLHLLRATVRNAECSKYCFVLDETEGWKVAIGLQRLRKGSQVRSLGMSGMKENEVRGLLGSLGWL